MKRGVTYIGSVAVETQNILVAAKVAAKASRADAVRGSVKVDGKPYRWSTIQQYEHHEGFTAASNHREGPHEGGQRR